MGARNSCCLAPPDRPFVGPPSVKVVHVEGDDFVFEAHVSNTHNDADAWNYIIGRRHGQDLKLEEAFAVRQKRGHHGEEFVWEGLVQVHKREDGRCVGTRKYKITDEPPQWMVGDVIQSGTPTSCEWRFDDHNPLAKYNPFRWSGNISFENCIRQLEDARAGPIAIKIPANDNPRDKGQAFESKEKALEHLRSLKTDDGVLWLGSASWHTKNVLKIDDKALCSKYELDTSIRVGASKKYEQVSDALIALNADPKLCPSGIFLVQASMGFAKDKNWHLLIRDDLAKVKTGESILESIARGYTLTDDKNYCKK